MTVTAVPMENLIKRISQQQAELESLRKEYEARQAHLANLKGRKRELETQLHQIDAQIEAAHHGDKAHSSIHPTVRAVEAQPMPILRTAKTGRGPKLADVLIKMVTRAKGAITVKQMSKEIMGQKFPTRSQNIPRMVQTRVQELVTKGVFERAKDQRGVVLAGSVGAKKFSIAKSQTTKSSMILASKAAAQPKRNGRKKMALRSLLTDLLLKSNGSLGARELAEQVQAQGYPTKSKNFLAVVRLMLSRMDNTENISGKGYRLKKR